MVCGLSESELHFSDNICGSSAADLFRQHDFRGGGHRGARGQVATIEGGSHSDSLMFPSRRSSACSDVRTAFSAETKPPKGKTKDGDACECSDSQPIRKSDAAAENFSKQQRLTAVQTANENMSGPYRNFKRLKAQYENLLQEAGQNFQTYAEQRRRYEQAWEKVKEMHLANCQPLVNKHWNVPLDCVRRQQKLAERFLARVKHPDCLVGKEVVLEPPQVASVNASLILAASLAASFEYDIRNNSGSGRLLQTRRHPRSAATVAGPTAPFPETERGSYQSAGSSQTLVATGLCSTQVPARSAANHALMLPPATSASVPKPSVASEFL